MKLFEARIEKGYSTRGFSTQSSLVTSGGQTYEGRLESTTYNEVLQHDYPLNRTELTASVLHHVKVLSLYISDLGAELLLAIKKTYRKTYFIV